LKSFRAKPDHRFAGCERGVFLVSEVGQIWKGVGVLIVQLETPKNGPGGARAEKKGILTILNPAPVRVLSSYSVIGRLLVPNEIEAQEITGGKSRKRSVEGRISCSDEAKM
jgi:hypothetical protein